MIIHSFQKDNGKKSMLFINLNVHWKNASPTIKKKSISYIGYNTTKLSRRLFLHISDSSSICQHLKNIIVLMQHIEIF